MGRSLFSNTHFQMGVTVMGFAEHFWLFYLAGNPFALWYVVISLAESYAPTKQDLKPNATKS